MIVSISGKIIQKAPTKIIIKTGGLGYSCNISANTFDKLPKLNQEVSLLTYFHVTENNQSLLDALTPIGIISYYSSISNPFIKTSARIMGINPDSNYGIDLLEVAPKTEFQVPAVTVPTDARLVALVIEF